MSLFSRSSIWAALRDRRALIGGAAALSAAAVLGAGLIAILASLLLDSPRTEAMTRETAEHARLSVVDQPAPDPPIQSASDKLPTLDLPTLDPGRIADQIADQKSETPDRALKAVLEQERRWDLQSAADQDASDARQADSQADVSPAAPERVQRGGRTSNSEDVPA